MNKFIIFTIIYVLVIICTAIIAFRLEKRNYYEKTQQKLSVVTFLNNYTTITLKVVLVGVLFGMIFGMMDNVSLYFGIEGLGDVLKEKFHMDNFQVAGYSNTYSGVLGITFATFVTLIAKYVFPDVNQDDLPVWINALGFLIGSIIGIYVPRFFMKYFN